MGQVSTNFYRGIAAAMDPVNAAVETEGHALTSLFSPWLHGHCKECGHSFRPGDEVYIGADGAVVHDSGLLPCKEGTVAVTVENTASSEAFFRGLDQAWPPPGNLPVVRLEQNHLLLAPAFAGFKRHSCAVCGHSFRLHDMVIICPCQPEAPMCQIAVHRDPLHNLNCWSLWGVGEGQKLEYCLATSRKLKE